MPLLKSISSNANVILIFLTLIILLFMINLFPRSMRDASNSIHDIRNLQKSVFMEDRQTGNLEMDHDALLTFLERFSYTYTGVEGQEFEIILDTLRWSASKYKETNSIIEKNAMAMSNRNQLDHLIEVYYEILESRYQAFDSLYYFLSVGVLVQFVFIFISYNKNLKSAEKLKQSRSELQSLQRIRENERRRIASYLHDSTIQDLGSILLSPEISNEPDLRFRLEDTITQLRNLTYSTSPLQLNNVGLEESVGELITNFQNLTGIHVIYRVNGITDENLTDEARLVCFRFIQEALNNIAKHAFADEVAIKIVYTSPFLNLAVEDNGVGMNLEKNNDEGNDKHMGLALMEEQVHSLGAEFYIISEPGAGTKIKMKYNLGKGEDDGQH